ncbi:hypothetical protein AB5I41_00935 [Sphingomonas sp. MMS24-JH45]
MTRRLAAIVAVLLALLPAPALAAVTIAFWSRDFDGNYFRTPISPCAARPTPAATD